MMTQSVMMQKANPFTGAATSTTSKSKQTGSGFEFIMGRSYKAEQSNTGKAELPDKKETAVSKDTSGEVDNESNNPNVKQKESTDEAEAKDAAKPKETVKSTDNKETSKETSTKDAATKDAATKVTTEQVTGTDQNSGKINGAKGKKTSEEQLLTDLTAMLQSIQEAVMKILHLTPEEFSQRLADQGISTIDLLQPDTLRQFALVNSGKTDILAALTDENLADSIKQLAQAIDQIKTESKLSFTDEQMKALLTKLEKVETVPKEQTDSITDSKLTQNSEINQKQDVNQKPETNQKVEVDVKQYEEVGTKQVANENIKQVTVDNKEQSKTVFNTRSDVQVEVIKSTEADNSAGTQPDTQGEKNRDLKSADQFQTFVDNLVNASQKPQVNFSDNMVPVMELKEIADQIIEHVKVVIKPDQTSMELQLNPESLGKVNLSIQLRNGVMTAQFVVQNEMSKEAIEGQMYTLRETLNGQGIKVEAIEVTVATYEFEQSNQSQSEDQKTAQKNQSGRKITLEDAVNMNELPEEERAIQDITGLLGSRIDYTA